MSELTALVAAIGASPSAEQLELLRTLVLQGALGDVKTVNVTDKAVDESSEKAQLAYTLRGRVWALLLGCGSTVAVDVAEYLSLITKKRADDSTYATIRGDTKRTYRKHKSFSERVSPQSMSRICNAISHKHGALYTYKQGMGCLPAVFLYTMPEPVAFRCVDRVISAVLPYHFAPPYYHGSRASVTFTKELLEAVDIELATHLNTLSQHQWPFMVVQPFIVSIGLANRPFDQLLPLFDFLIAAGFENNVSFCLFVCLLY
jgi:hypothetical protein